MRTSTAAMLALALAAPLAIAGAQSGGRPERDRPSEPQARLEREGARGRARGDAEYERAARMNGSFVLAVSQAEAERVVGRAIDETAGHLSVFVRGSAVRRLREKNPVRSRIETVVGNGRVSITYGDERHVTQDGQWRTVSTTGERLELYQAARGDRIVQIFRAPDGQRTTIYRFSEDGSQLRIDVTITSPRLPSALRYTLPYRRVPSQRAAPV